MTNDEFKIVIERIEKAIITSADGGKMNPQQADKFIDYVVDLSGLKNNVRVEKFTQEQSYIDKIGVHKRVAMPATEAVDPGTRRGINTSRLPLTPKEIIVPFEISKTFLEVNLEGKDVEDHIVQMMAAQLANDLEELYINGDILGPAILEEDYVEGGSATDYVRDGFMALADGWLRQADASHLVDWEDAAISPMLFSDMLNAMPDKFKKNYADMRFIMSRSLEQNYRLKVGTRETKEGDDSISTAKQLTPFGVPLASFPLYPFGTQVVEHIALAGTTVNALRYKPIEVSSETVLDATLGATPELPYIEGTDYNMDYDLGTIARDAGGSIGDPTTCKVTYTAKPTVLLCHYNNLILAIGRDIEIDTDKDIFKRVKQYAMTVKVDVLLEETDAVVKAYNISKSVS